jgi:hypothetical protein
MRGHPPPPLGVWCFSLFYFSTWYQETRPNSLVPFQFFPLPLPPLSRVTRTSPVSARRESPRTTPLFPRVATPRGATPRHHPMLRDLTRRRFLLPPGAATSQAAPYRSLPLLLAAISLPCLRFLPVALPPTDPIPRIGWFPLPRRHHNVVQHLLRRGQLHCSRCPDSHLRHLLYLCRCQIPCAHDSS